MDEPPSHRYSSQTERVDGFGEFSLSGHAQPCRDQITMTASNERLHRFRTAMAAFPLVAILRGIRPEEVEPVGAALYEAGFRLIEVPLNSPDPYRSIALLRRALPLDAVVGAGTILAVEQLAPLRETGGELAIMPHCDPALITAATAQGFITVPGVATPSEAFAALAAGAEALKAFPAEMLAPKVIKAWRAVLPADRAILMVGGITPDHIAPYRDAGAAGFGLGSDLYRPGSTAEAVGARAHAFAQAWSKYQSESEG
jgi:2-dehydro-3-deoxyphosphogalactonate aldolase